MSEMDRPIRRVGLGVVVLFLLLAGQLTYLQAVRGPKLADDPRNVRVIFREFKQPRGRLLSADRVELAVSVPSDDEFAWQRRYPNGELYQQITGYQSIVYGTVGAERRYNEELLGRTLPVRTATDAADLLTGRAQRADVTLTVLSNAQQAAAAALGGRDGSIVVLDVRTGGVVALYSNPTFDPNLLASHDATSVRNAFEFLKVAPDNPMLSRAYRQLYPPGSTFKVVTASVGIEAGVTEPTKEYPELRALDLPLTDNTLENFGGSLCGGTLRESFIRSCNTTFGQIGLDLGDRFPTDARRWGFGADRPPIDLIPGAVESLGLTPNSFKTRAPEFALAGIGQGPVAATPLQMAMVAQTVANGGVMLTPHVMQSVADESGRVVTRYRPKPWREPMQTGTAALLTDMMRAVVTEGTATAAQIPGVTVAGKTGTAQVDGADAPHAWFIGFAPAEAPRYAIAVLVENGGDLGSEATGGAVAAPMARAVLSALLLPAAP